MVALTHSLWFYAFNASDFNKYWMRFVFWFAIECQMLWLDFQIFHNPSQMRERFSEKNFVLGNVSAFSKSIRFYTRSQQNQLSTSITSLFFLEVLCFAQFIVMYFHAPHHLLQNFLHSSWNLSFKPAFHLSSLFSRLYFPSSVSVVLTFIWYILFTPLYATQGSFGPCNIWRMCAFYLYPNPLDPRLA